MVDKDKVIKNYFIILFCLALAAGHAQSSSPTMSARAMALGNTGSVLRDEWSLLNNIGGLSKVTRTTTAFSHYAVPSFKPFNRLAATIALPVKIGVAGAGVYRFGDDIYSEQIVSLGYSNQFGLAALGAKINYVQYKAEGYGTRNAFTVSFGGVAEITPRFFIGAHIENINQPKLSNQSEERIPARFIIGTGLQLSEKVLAVAELEKDVVNNPIVKAGLEYILHKKFIARTGFNLNPQSAFGGLGFIVRKFKLDYGFQFQEYFGAAHQATVSASLGKTK